MKLHRFTAANNQTAIHMVQAALGPNALIYSTRRTATGIEILAGVPSADDDKPEFVEAPQPSAAAKSTASQQPEQKQIQPREHHPQYVAADSDLAVLKEQIAHMATTVASMAEQIQTQCMEQALIADDEYFIRKNYLYYYLSKYGFRGQFCHHFVQSYLKARKPNDTITDESIEKSLVKYILTHREELIGTKKAYALVGPTGAGKTTTIIKLAERHLTQHPNTTIGFITTNYQDLVNKNYLLNYSELLEIDLEFANTPKELSLVLTKMKDKELILVDTAGFSQHDQTNIQALRSLIESQGGLLDTYLVMPCNLQEPIIDELIRCYSTLNTKGCILTKQDESINLAPVMSACMQYRLSVAYVCNGQDLGKDIHLVTPQEIIVQIMRDSTNRKQKLEKNLKKNMQRIQRFAEYEVEI